MRWQTDERTLADRSQTLGADDLFTLNSSNAVARDKRGLGDYQESLDIARRVVAAFEAAGGRENIRWLQACQGFATALRKAGHHWDALQESEHVLQRCRDYLGMEHMYTLKAAIDLINDQARGEDFAGAEELARETHDLCPNPAFPACSCTPCWSIRVRAARWQGARTEALPYDDAGEGRAHQTIHGDMATRSRSRLISTTPPILPAAAGWARRSSLAPKPSTAAVPPRRRSPRHADGGGQPLHRRGRGG